jgi:uncharacterized membrane protein (UPF0127 family)
MPVLYRLLPYGKRIPILQQLQIADSFFSRLRGWLFRHPPHPEEGLWIEPCHAVHTVGMRHAIDLVFLDRDGRVMGWIISCPPNRVMKGPQQTTKVLELMDGKLNQWLEWLVLGEQLVPGQEDTQE